MDLDEMFPAKTETGAALHSDLSQLSIADLGERINDLKAEIIRVEQELAARQSSRSAAESAFKS